MSEFEFVLILLTVVAGFAVSEILSGWGMLIRERIDLRDVGVYLLASSWLLLMIVRYVWVLWVLRGIEWQFLDFVFAFIPILVLALAAFVINPTRAVRFVPATHYMNQARPFCYLAAVFFIVWNFGTLRSFFSEAGLNAAQMLGFAIAIMLIGLANIRKQMIHAVCLALMIVTVVLISTVAVTNLGRS